MQLLFLGTGGYHPSDLRQTACLMLPEIGVVLDAGTAMFRVRDHLVTDTLDIFLTHAHLDHVIGLTYLFDVLWEREMQRVTVHGEAEKLAAVDAHLFAKAVFPAKPPFETQVLSGETTLPNDGRLSWFPLSHPGGSVGYRLDWPDRSMAYVTDTTATAEPDYLEKIRGVDLLIHECHFEDGWEAQAELTGHSCLTPVAKLAAAADVGRLMLTHVNPLSDGKCPVDLNVARAIFPNTTVAEDNMLVEI